VQHTLQGAVDMVGRYAMIHPEASEATIRGRLQDRIQEMGVHGASVAVTVTTETDGVFVTLVAQMEGTLAQGILPLPTINLFARSRVLRAS